MAHCHSENNAQDAKKPRPWYRRLDYLLWGSFTGIAILYALAWLAPGFTAQTPWLHDFAGGVFELMNLMWWSLLLAIVLVGLIGQIPREFITSILGKGGGISGIFRATLAGVLLDLCSHGILMVGMRLYERGASLGQVVAFLLASPWNSFSLTLILIALIGLPWTLAFIAFSMGIGIVSGLVFDMLTRRGVLPENPNDTDLPDNFRFWGEAKSRFRKFTFDAAWLRGMLWDGMKGSRMVLRWIFFGVLLAGAVRGFVSPEAFQDWFGPSLAGLGLTIIAATILEVCSEGTTPVAAEIVNRAGAPGNGFAFLMTGVSTDYTEIMSLKETTRSWKIALFLPLVTVPQVLLVSWLINTYMAG